MKKHIVLGAGAVSAAAVSMALFGTGVAVADDYAGQTYADASSAASSAGQTVVVAARVGDKVALDECLVTRSQAAPFLGTDFSHVANKVQFYLNCNAGVASANTAGNSAASPAGREAAAAAAKAAAQQGG